MGRYKIEVSIKIKDCDDVRPGKLRKNEAGNFELSIEKNAGEDIDRCEQALLEVNSEALRDALSEHLTEVSKKNFGICKKWGNNCQ